MQFVENAGRASRAHCFGFHVKIYQLTTWQRVEDVHGWLANLNARGWKIIYLRRENLLAHMVSNIFAEVAGAWHHRKDEISRRPERITLPVNEMNRTFTGRRICTKAEQLALKGLDHLELVYERDLEIPEAHDVTFTRIQSYVGIDNIQLRPPLKKAVAKPLENLIENYDEVYAALKGAPDEIFLCR